MDIRATVVGYTATESLPFLPGGSRVVRVFLRGCVRVRDSVERGALSFFLSLFLSPSVVSPSLAPLVRSLVNRNPRCFSSRVFVARKKPHRARRQKRDGILLFVSGSRTLNQPSFNIYTIGRWIGKQKRIGFSSRFAV